MASPPSFDDRPRGPFPNVNTLLGFREFENSILAWVGYTDITDLGKAIRSVAPGWFPGDSSTTHACRTILQPNPTLNTAADITQNLIEPLRAQVCRTRTTAETLLLITRELREAIAAKPAKDWVSGAANAFFQLQDFLLNFPKLADGPALSTTPPAVMLVLWLSTLPPATSAALQTTTLLSTVPTSFVDFANRLDKLVQDGTIPTPTRRATVASISTHLDQTQPQRAPARPAPKPNSAARHPQPRHPPGDQPHEPAYCSKCGVFLPNGRISSAPHHASCSLLQHPRNTLRVLTPSEHPSPPTTKTA
jgi:hypothetical protein